MTGMVLTDISLSLFRNFDKKTFSFSPDLTIIIGKNSAGKTNILEGVYLSIYGNGFRESKEEELMNFDAGSNPSQITAHFVSDKRQREYKVILTKKKDLLEKAFFVDKSKKTLRNYSGEQTRAVLFAPAHIEIITGAMSGRREYFNKLLSSFDFEYKKRLSQFEQAVRRRNKILEHHRDEQSLMHDLEFWNTYIEENAVYLVQKREEYAAFINSHPSIDEYEFRLEYRKNEFTKERAKEYFDLEKRVRRTMIGPQKDDYSLFITRDAREKDVHHFGSRSEQRLSVLWLKMNEIYYLEEHLKIRPILLFDDIFSEFDAKNKKIAVELVRHYQSIMTTTEADVMDMTSMPKAVIKV